MKKKFLVYDKHGKNVTDEKDWFTDKNGELYYLSSTDKLVKVDPDYYHVAYVSRVRASEYPLGF